MNASYSVSRILILTIILFANFLISPFSIAQTNDQSVKAKKILDEVSTKTKKYSSINAHFSFTIESKEKKISEQQEGDIWVKGNKYKLALKNQTVFSDGQTVWTFLKDANEVQINSADQKEDEDKITPNNIFTIYEKGFKYEFVKEEKKGNVITQIINLFPLEPKKKSYHTAVVYVDKNKKQINKMIIKGKDGNTSTYSVRNFKTNENLSDEIFVFNKANYPKVETVDLRE